MRGAGDTQQGEGGRYIGRHRHRHRQHTQSYTYSLSLSLSVSLACTPPPPPPRVFVYLISLTQVTALRTGPLTRRTAPLSFKSRSRSSII